MRLKKLHLKLLGISVAICNAASAQLFIDQATFTIQPGATVTVQGDVTSNADILGTGKVILKGTTNQNINMGGFAIPNVEIDNTSNVTLTGNAKVNGDILFTNGKVLVGNSTLTLASAGTITGATATKFVVTNGTGKLVKAALGATAFTFPIGNSTTSYDPIAVANSGTADDIGARSFANVLASGATGTAFTKETVNNSWELTEATAGGSNLSLTTTWNAADELAGFDRSRGGISYYIPTAGATQGWDLLNSQTGAATGSDPFTYTRAGFTSVGVFAVGTRPVLSPLLVSPKVFLQGPYNGGTFVMNENLRTLNLIPSTEPYSSASGGNYMSTVNTTRGSGGGETADNSVIGSVAPSGNNAIVDWVLVQLHSTATGNPVITQRAALLQRDGDVVDVDGVSPVNLAGNIAGTYFISVRHRNHLGVRSTSNFALAKTASTSYNFSDGLAKAFLGSITTNNAMIVVSSAGVTPAVYGMYAGNANGVGPGQAITTQKSGPPAINDYATLLTAAITLPSTNIYSKTDFNMDGKITKSGPNALANDYARFLNVFIGLSSAVLTQPSF